MNTKQYEGAPVIALIGRSGAGKDTQMRVLLERFDAVNISTGDLTRALITTGSPLGLFAKGILATGEWNFPSALDARSFFEALGARPSPIGRFAAKLLGENRIEFSVASDAKSYLLPDWMALLLFLEGFEKIPPSRWVICSSSPRRLNEAHFMDEMVQNIGRPPLLPVYIHVDEDVAIERLLNRRWCKPCGIYALPSSVVVPRECERCGGALSVREGDNDMENIMGRLHYFKERVIPLLEYFDGLGRLIWIDGDQGPDAVSKSMIDQIHARVVAMRFS